MTEKNEDKKDENNSNKYSIFSRLMMWILYIVAVVVNGLILFFMFDDLLPNKIFSKQK
tara:strand:+ start:681 stop:854 length:174 start_codon:yes stop_codon:yes gene_type:complete